MTRSAQLWWGAGTLVAGIVLGALVTGAFGFQATAVDLWWNGVMAELRPEFAVGVAHVFDEVGGGWIATAVVPIAIAVALLVARRWRAAIFALLALAISAGLVQALKQLFGRARPEDMLVFSDYGSFPSGHAANAATIAAVAVLLFPRLWVAIVGALWMLAMALSRTLLSVHWLSDTVGGALVGVSVPLLLAALMLGWVTQTPVAAEPAGPVER